MRVAALALLLLLTAACVDDDMADGPTAAASRSGQPIATASPSPSPTPYVRPDLTPARVVRVVDGDTIRVEIEGEEFAVRYIGMDTPETVDPRRPVGCFGKEASERNRELVEGQVVGLEKDVSETDRFGRLLRYIWAGDEMVNAALVRDGYAQAATYPPDVRYQEMFLQLQQEARQAGRGLWGPACASPAATG